jgi:ArsR family metal-binding transcriptional regulator
MQCGATAQPVTNITMPELDRVAVFARPIEFEKARALLLRLELPFEVVSPGPAYARVGAPGLLCDSRATTAILSDHGITCSGYTDNFEAPTVIPNEAAESFAEDVFGEAVIMFYGPCMADELRVRLVAHLSRNVSAALPYLNGAMPQACFNAGPCTLTFMDGGRMVTVYPQRIAIGKADGIVDSWRTLEKIRLLVNRTWARRDSITPLYERRSKPPALEIYKRLPRTNCKQCGQQTCMAFAVSLWQGQAVPNRCRPAFEDEQFIPLRAALIEICQGLGVDVTGV